MISEGSQMRWFEWMWVVQGWGGAGGSEAHRGLTDERRVAALVPMDSQTSKTPRDHLWGFPNEVVQVGCGWCKVHTYTCIYCEVMTMLDSEGLLGCSGGTEAHHGPTDVHQVMAPIPIDLLSSKIPRNNFWKSPNKVMQLEGEMISEGSQMRWFEWMWVVQGWGGAGGSEAHRGLTDERRVAALVPMDSQTSKTPRDHLWGFPNEVVQGFPNEVVELVQGWGGGGGSEAHRGPTDERRVAALIPIDLPTSKTPRNNLWGSPNEGSMDAIKNRRSKVGGRLQGSLNELGGVGWGWCMVGRGGDNEGHREPTNERRVAALVLIDSLASKTPGDKL
ncbi:hypothetical protein BDN72DRAFT_864948 [Pluteus cervinus]|uniref:Uncharacterized protein n=1 Tax=Pluteus cervinus TaxID=181527 RepID=A0ACD3A1F5_9AGAR|nr:hypothetical protein BDN72DRAFT_864948 [Pluteus cervinus]